MGRCLSGLAHVGSSPDYTSTFTKPLFQEMMVSGSLSKRSKRPVTMIIPDGLLSFAVEIGIETSTPVICFETISPCCLWTSYFNLENLIEAGNVPFKGAYSTYA